MTDAARPGGDSAADRDPWAPPESRPSLHKDGDAGPARPQEPPRAPADDVPPWQPPPAVHDQPTVTSMPNAGFGGGPDGAVPPPPVAPGGPAPAPGAAPGYGYPGYPQGYSQGYGWPGMPMPPQNGMGTASMVLGILACALFCMYGVVSVVLGVLAVVFGVKGRRRAEQGLANNHGQAQAGFVMGIVGIILGVVVIALIAIGITAAINEDSDYDDPYYGAVRQVPVPAAAQR
ncbi:DUF4190 domain-containing protein [Streptomyces olivaceus]|uniref:DUF4190 domain-containing protein n=1 Tax=Streptomyces olivaceus TaxID=47716 RepID=UPI0018856619|nr:DUF4190 domain-containing protein [Streptomyces olivaceus]